MEVLKTNDSSGFRHRSSAATGRAVQSSITLSYTDEEREFLKAIDAYKTNNRRPHPTWHEVLAVFKSLGYEKRGKDA